MRLNSFDHMVRKRANARTRNHQVNCRMEHPDFRTLGNKHRSMNSKAMDRTWCDEMSN